MKSSSQALTPRQVVAALLALFVFAGCGFGGYELYAAAHRHYLLNAAIPKVLELMKGQRADLLAAIEEYRRHYGIYPPAPSPPSQPAGVLNPLFYELAGTRYRPERQAFYDRTQKEPIVLAAMLKNFGLSAFTNSFAFPDWPTDFLTPRQLPKKEFSEGSGVYGVGLNTAGLPDEVIDDLHLSPWRYALAPSAGEGGGVHLWMEMTTRGKPYVVGNALP
jgi:hypothetical protein